MVGLSELDLKIVECILAKWSVTEILKVLNIDFRFFQERLHELEKSGFTFSPEYYNNGSIKYTINNNLKPSTDKLGNIIVNKNDDNYFETVIISDVHLGSDFERLDVLNRVYEYCVREGIHIILNGGDFINGGIIGSNFRDLQIKQAQQIDAAIHNYPYDPSIINFLVLGNHDYYALKNCFQDLTNVLKTYRPDIIPLGYQLGRIMVRNSGITMFHPIHENKLPVVNDSIVIKGHTHKMDYYNRSGPLYVQPSALVDFDGNDKFYLLRLRVYFNHGYFSEGLLTQVLINDFSTVNEMPFTLKRKKHK